MDREDMGRAATAVAESGSPESAGGAVVWSAMEPPELAGELREVIERNLPGRAPREPAEHLEWRRAWARVLFGEGIAAPAWPVEWYGMGLSLPQLVAYYETMAEYRLPGAVSPGAGMVGPAILLHGTDEQRRHFLPRVLRGDDVWCQGFSEPEAGSDLPALRTTAIRDGDHYVVNGQKVWTTLATEATWCFALVRTGPEGSRQRGISYLLVDMASPGIEVRPLKTMAGNTHFAELFFTDVAVPVEQRVGAENEGWRVTRTTLGHERSTNAIGKNARYRLIVDDLAALARDRGLSSDPVMRDRLANLAIGARLVEWSGRRILQLALASGEIGAISSTSRLLSTQFEQRLHETAMDVLGATAMLAPSESERKVGRWVNGFLMTRATTIGGGTSEIQRNTIGEQILGLGREPGMPER